MVLHQLQMLPTVFLTACVSSEPLDIFRHCALPRERACYLLFLLALIFCRAKGRFWRFWKRLLGGVWHCSLLSQGLWFLSRSFRARAQTPLKLRDTFGRVTLVRGEAPLKLRHIVLRCGTSRGQLLLHVLPLG